MISKKTKIEKKLSKIHHVDYVTLTGNGTIALVIALESLGLKNKKIAVPVNACYSVPQAVIFSGNEPVYFDIDLTNFGILPLNFENIDAVICIHAYGKICSIEKIKNYCNEQRIPLIEDCCVSQGASYESSPVGSFGDISILSFGSGKIIDIAHGGAILCNDINYFRKIRSKIDSLNEINDINNKQILNLGLIFTKLYNSNYIKNKNVDHSFFNEMIKIKESYYFKFNLEFLPMLDRELDRLNDNIYQRKEKAFLLQKAFGGLKNAFLITNSDKEVYWRQNLLIHKKRNELLFYLLRKGFLISSWYPTVSTFLLKEKGIDCFPNSEYLTDRVLNFWVNDQADEKYIKSITDQVYKFYDNQ